MRCHACCFATAACVCSKSTAATRGGVQGTAPTSSNKSCHAVLVGGGLPGSLHPKAVSAHFARVTVLERVGVGTYRSNVAEVRVQMMLCRLSHFSLVFQIQYVVLA